MGNLTEHLRGLASEENPKRKPPERDDPERISNRLSREQWAGRLNGEWHALKDNAVEGFFEFGRSLITAKADIIEQHGRGLWLEMLESDLHFNKRVAQSFIRIATWGEQKRVQNSFSNTVGFLPPDYNCVEKLSRLEDDVFERLLRDGVICPSMRQNEVNKILRLERVQADEQRILKLVPKPGKYRTIVIDPAWEYDWLSLAGRAKPGYAMQTVEQLYALDLKQWADQEVGCHLYCCVTNNFIAVACKLVEHWGWQHRTIITWLKPPPFGLGSYFRNSTEQIIFATLGDTSTRPAAASIPTHFEAPRGEHSEKPEQFYNIVRAASYPPYGEGNQREPRPDFTNLFETVEEEEDAPAEG